MWAGRKRIAADASNLMKVLGGSFTVTVDITVEDKDGVTVHHLEMESPRGTVQVMEKDGEVQAWLLS